MSLVSLDFKSAKLVLRYDSFYLKIKRFSHKSFLQWSVLLCLVSQSCPTLCTPMDCTLPGSSVLGNSSGKNPGECSLLFQEIFPIQELNQGLLRCRQVLYQLNYQGRPNDILVIAYNSGWWNIQSSRGSSCEFEAHFIW